MTTTDLEAELEKLKTSHTKKVTKELRIKIAEIERQIEEKKNA